MSHSTQKFIAVLFAIWLPLFSGSVMAAAVSMQLQRGSCHEAAAMQEMRHGDDGKHQHHHTASSAAHHETASHDPQGSPCSACGVCHLACSGYLAVSGLEASAVQQTDGSVTPYLLSFHSITSTPLVPPPLARA